jgi:serine phosphatase RsbU (regulator of sigma subunit)
MPVECRPPLVTTAERNGAQLRYDALIALVAKWNRLSSIEEAARTLVSGVKFVLSLDAWRFLLLDSDGAFVVVEGNLAHTTIEEADARALSPIERALFDSGAPLLWDEATIVAKGSDIPHSMHARGLRAIYGTSSPGAAGRTDYALLIGTRAALSPLDLKFTGLLAGLFADKLRQLRAEQRLRTAYRQLAERDSKIYADLCESRDFQRSLLPAEQHVAGLEIATVFEPVDMVGGDVYDIIVLPDGRLRVFLVDATGHGVQAAMRTMVLLSEYNNLKYRSPTPGDLLRSLNARLSLHHTPLELLSPAVCADLEPGGRRRKCTIANAGAPPALLANREGCRVLEADGGMLLGMDETIALEEITTYLNPGDRVLFATDGLYDQRSPDKKPLAYEPCAEVLASASSIPDCVAAMRMLFDTHRGAAARDDDLTALFIGVLPAGNERPT